MNSLQQLITLLNQNNIAAASIMCQQMLAQTPDSAELHNSFGIIAAKTNNWQQSIASFKQAIALAPTNATYYNNLSNAYKKHGDLALAKQTIRQALQLAPHYAEAYNNLGSLYYTEGCSKEAISYFEKAIRLNPGYWEPHYNLANCLIKDHQINRAISHYQTVLTIKPTFMAAKQNLAMAYIAAKQIPAALPYLEEAAAGEPTHAELQAQLAEAYLDTGATTQAIQAFKRALQLSPAQAIWHHNLAVLYLREQQPEQALEHFKATLQYAPDNPTAQHMVQALANLDSQTAPPQYVAALFDQYSSYYNQHVKEQLQYQAPELLRQLVSNYLAAKLKPLNILDIGCGTGLCSKYFRDLAQYLVGIDLSTAMLAEAKNLTAYDALCQGNICQSLPGANQHFFDLIIAADVLGYCGELTTIFSLCASALKTSGLLAFTCEQLPHGEFKLQPTGRFAHSSEYVLTVATAAGFKLITNQAITLRLQQKQPIPGEIYLLRYATD